MNETYRARACANIALSKYWGKQSGERNVPATPSISLALDRLETVTEIRRKKAGPDEIEINGQPAEPVATGRIIRLLDSWRSEGFLRGSFFVSSRNEFPTASGLASSASGFAALVQCLSGFSEVKFNRDEMSRLARRGSGSAARSIPGGLAALPLEDDPAAVELLPAEKVPFGMVVAIVDSPAKEIGSTRGMRLSKDTSPYYHSWVNQAAKDYHNLLAAIKEMNIGRIGEIAEANALAMHACMIATRPSLLYWTGTTVEIVSSVRDWRDDGIEAYATIDAGPHVALLTPLPLLDEVERLVAGIQGVRTCLPCRPAGPAEMIE